MHRWVEFLPCSLVQPASVARRYAADSCDARAAAVAAAAALVAPFPTKVARVAPGFPLALNLPPVVVCDGATGR